MTKVIIELEFEGDDEVTEADVINYLNELIDNDCLAFSKLDVMSASGGFDPHKIKRIQ